MAEVTIEKLANDIGTTVDKLVQQFKDAGITKSVSDNVTEDEKTALLDHLSRAHGGEGTKEPSRMTLTRKSKSTLSVQGTAGKSKSVQVEVRKSRTYVKKSALEEQQAEQARIDAEEKARVDAEQAARLEAEAAAAAQAAAEAEAPAAQDADDFGDDW